MNRIAGIITAAVGLILAILSVVKILPGFTITGVLLVLLGGLIIGLSFVAKPESDGTPRMNTAESLIKIFYAPAEVFQNLRRHPRWLAAVIIMAALAAVYQNAFLERLTPAVVVGYRIDKTKDMPMMDDNAKKGIEAGRAAAVEDSTSVPGRAAQSVNSFVFLVFWIAFLAAVFLLFAMTMGGKINYWQAFAAAAYSSFPIWVIGQILNLILLYLKDPTEIHPILGGSSLVQDSLNFLASPAESPILYSLLSMFGLLIFYQIWLRAIGLKNAGERISPTAAWTAALALWFVMLLLSLALAFAFPSFLS